MTALEAAMHSFFPAERVEKILWISLATIFGLFQKCYMNKATRCVKDSTCALHELLTLLPSDKK